MRIYLGTCFCRRLQQLDIEGIQFIIALRTFGEM